MTKQTKTKQGRGRPPVGPPITTRLSAEAIRWLDREAARTGRSRAGVIRLLVGRAMADQQRDSRGA